jgi:hypothetical protein
MTELEVQPLLILQVEKGHCALGGEQALSGETCDIVIIFVLTAFTQHVSSVESLSTT